MRQETFGGSTQYNVRRGRQSTGGTVFLTGGTAKGTATQGAASYPAGPVKKASNTSVSNRDLDLRNEQSDQVIKMSS